MQEEGVQREVQEQFKMEPSWKEHLSGECAKSYMSGLRQFLLDELRDKKVIYPKPSQYFEAFNRTPYDKVKVVILGQDPYHGPGQAHGLCFSVPKGTPLPPSLKNIYQELSEDLKVPAPREGSLERWAEQGVLLLNAVLSVEKGCANSHSGKGWEEFTDRAIEALNQRKDPVIFVLWGSYAQKKGGIIDRKRHVVLSAPHPSPLSAHRGFFGSRPFSKINEHLIQMGKNPIRWID